MIDEKQSGRLKGSPRAPAGEKYSLAYKLHLVNLQSLEIYMSMCVNSQGTISHKACLAVTPA